MNIKQLRNGILLTTLSLGAMATSYSIRASSPQAPATQPASPVATDALFSWLQVTPEDRTQIQQHDPAFASDLLQLRTELTARRQELASVLDDPASSDQTIRARVEAVLASSTAIERRITRYLLEIRHHLTAAQQRRLFGLCAMGLRQGPGWGAGWGGGRGPGRGPGNGPDGRGGGWGAGTGPGPRGGGPNGAGPGRGMGRMR